MCYNTELMTLPIKKYQCFQSMRLYLWWLDTLPPDTSAVSALWRGCTCMTPCLSSPGCEIPNTSGTAYTPGPRLVLQGLRARSWGPKSHSEGKTRENTDSEARITAPVHLLSQAQQAYRTVLACGHTAVSSVKVDFCRTISHFSLLLHGCGTLMIWT